MNKTFVLFKAQAIHSLRINEICDSNNRKKNNLLIVGFGIAAVILLVCMYTMFVAKTLVKIGQEILIPAYMVGLTSFILLFLTMFRSNGMLFGSKDMEILTSLPIKKSEIIVSKLAFLYVLNVCACMMFMVPSGIVWVLNTNKEFAEYFLYYISILFVPLIPMCIASFIGILIVLITSRIKNNNLFAAMVSFTVLGVFVIISYFNFSNGETGGDIGLMIGNQITALYPLAKLFLINDDFLSYFSMLLFIFLSIAMFALFIKIISVKHSVLNSIFQGSITANTHCSVNYKKTENIFKKRSSFTALYLKELKRFFSSYTAILNTGLGIVVLICLSIIVLAVPVKQISDFVGISSMNVLLPKYAPLIAASLFSLSCFTAYSLSLEGKNIWILQTSPISVKTIVDSKIAVNLTIHAVGYVFAVVAFLAKLNMSLVHICILIAVPVFYSLFIAVLGIFLNQKYVNYTWDSETMIIKQSIPVILSGIIGALFTGIPALLIFFLKVPDIFIFFSLMLIISILSIVMYLKVIKIHYI